MKIKVNKNQWLDDYENYITGNWTREMWGSDLSVTPNHNTGEFKMEDVTPEQLMDYINKGYGIKINC